MAQILLTFFYMYTLLLLLLIHLQIIFTIAPWLNLKIEFAMKDLRPLNYFLGTTVSRHQNGLFLYQKKYNMEALECVYMSSYKPINNPIGNKGKVSSTGGPP